MTDGNRSISVSVIMPAYNSERFVRIAIESVLAQTVRDIELLVIDDCSTDGTADAVSEYLYDPRVRYIRMDANSGAPGARNKGLELAGGKYVAFIDSDDEWLPDKLERQLHTLEKKGADAVCTGYNLINENGEMRGEYSIPEEISTELLLSENVIGCSTVMLSSRIFDKYRFGHDFFHEDYVLWLRVLGDGYTFVGIKEPYVNYRVMSTSKAGNKLKSAKHRYDIYRRFMHMSPLKSCRYLLRYTLRGIMKYRGVR